MINAEIYIIEKELDVAKVVMEAGALAKKIGFTSSLQHQIATAVSELSKNIINHAYKGTLTLGMVMNNYRKGIEIIAEDEGPGIENIEKALTDHFSTRQSLGLGLSAVKRMMDELEITTHLNRGTTITARKWCPKEANLYD